MSYLTREGVPVKLETRTCATCIELEANTHLVGTALKTTYKCALTNRKVHAEVYACVLYPKVNQWVPDLCNAFTRSNEDLKDAR